MDKLQSLTQRQAQARQLTDKLGRSLKIQELWPGVFDADQPVKAAWIKPAGVALKHPAARRHPAEGLVFRITCGGDTREFTPEQVPEELLPRSVIPMTR